MTTLRLFHPTDTARRLAVVAIQPVAGQEGEAHVSVAVGASRFALTESALYGPMPIKDALARLAEVEGSLRADGYLPRGVAALLETISTSSSPRARARAARRVALRGEQAAVAALVARAQKPKDDIGSVVLALGELANAAGLSAAAKDAIDAEAGRKLLSRRRAGAEAARRSGDPGLVAAVVARAKERLVDAGVSVVSSAEKLLKLLLALPAKDRGPALDALYDVGSDDAVAAVRAYVRAADSKALTAPGSWRFTKSVFKRALARGDGETLGAVMARVERAGHIAKGGTIAELKSGLDGETRATRVFSQRTADYLRRAAWRHLAAIGRHQPARYCALAARAVIDVLPTDDVVPRGRVPAAGHCYLLMRVCAGGDDRYIVDRRRPIHRLRAGKAPPKPTEHTEAFAPLWREAPAEARLLLVRAAHRDVSALGVRLAARDPRVIADASAVELVAMLRHAPLREPVTARLRQRLGASGLDLDTVIALARVPEADDGAGAAHALAAQAVTDAAHVWTRDARTSIALLQCPGVVAEVAARLLRAALPALTAATRTAFAAALVDAVESAAPQRPSASGSDDGPDDGPLVELVDLVATEVRAACGLERARRLLAHSAAGASIAAIVIGGADDAVDLLGLPELLRLAAHAHAAWRTVAIAALRAAPVSFAARLGLLFELLEGEWDDVRAAGIDTFRTIESAKGAPFDLDVILAVCDSTWPAVQAEGQRLARAALAAGTVDAALLLARLAQHPHPAMRAFVLDLAEGAVGGGLRPGLTPLLRLEPLLRAALFDVRPSRRLRARLVALLSARGAADEAQGELAASVLLDVARSRTHALRDDALAALVHLAACWPNVAAACRERGVAVVVAAGVPA